MVQTCKCSDNITHLLHSFFANVKLVNEALNVKASLTKTVIHYYDDSLASDVEGTRFHKCLKDIYEMDSRWGR